MKRIFMIGTVVVSLVSCRKHYVPINLDTLIEGKDYYIADVGVPDDENKLKLVGGHGRECTTGYEPFFERTFRWMKQEFSLTVPVFPQTDNHLEVWAFIWGIPGYPKHPPPFKGGQIVEIFVNEKMVGILKTPRRADPNLIIPYCVTIPSSIINDKKEIRLRFRSRVSVPFRWDEIKDHRERYIALDKIIITKRIKNKNEENNAY